MLKVRRRGSSFTVETGGGRLVRDARRGGLITDFTVYNALEHRPLVPPGGVLADVTASVNGTLVRLSDGQAEMQVAKRLEDYLVLSTRTRLADGLLEIVQDYEVHEEGAVFVHLAISVSSEAALDLADIAIPVRLKVDARKARWGYYTRQPKYTRDYSTIHAFVGFSLFRVLAEGDNLRELFPYVSLEVFRMPRGAPLSNPSGIRSRCSRAGSCDCTIPRISQPVPSPLGRKTYIPLSGKTIRVRRFCWSPTSGISRRPARSRSSGVLWR